MPVYRFALEENIHGRSCAYACDSRKLGKIVKFLSIRSSIEVEHVAKLASGKIVL